MELLNYTIQDEKGRLDKVLTEVFSQFSRSQIQGWLKDGRVTVNEEVTRANYKVKHGDKIEISRPEPRVIEAVAQDIPLEVIYEDDEVMVINKPQGMVVHPSAGHPDGTLVNALMNHSDKLSTINDVIRPGIVHRIDKDTSGLLMVAKNDEAHLFLADQLKERKALRKYVALVHGVIPHDKGTITAPIGRSKDNRQKQAVVKDGKLAVTHFEVLERFSEFTLVECQLETGRTHQIRVHMNYIEFPIAGDPLYGPRKTLQGNGQFLHAKTLGFEHPKTHEVMTFSSDLPEVFNKTLEDLRNNVAFS
ncbi:RluA family pseudouridine synthase [Vagococcus carniphilus]|uniref:Pseudouridine synthase n=1 Tax=Vagococcus carniphilus TaxID=218144 RepID=A0AAW8UC69_9ENTE|nr:RluA family pseudouridine synthase [Vagococcus carniphilus]MDT2832016.1 RluA family pseudouridine synthase [Vagococcus carniphilus]MDT2834580.1 RluA family pseudouridine synthase [Vagococcus carniphilus]MDT2840843.1 RluA family pseudouridine synthase [Vagococcus carniphilus]MDT2855507.1 RluA family pseudouridine synthase [Vagococcus carniphilus]